MTYEEMQILHDDLNIVEMDLSEVSGLKGLYVNGHIAINAKMSDIEKACVLAEELGHHYTTYGNILNQSDIFQSKTGTACPSMGVQQADRLTRPDQSL